MIEPFCFTTAFRYVSAAKREVIRVTVAFQPSANQAPYFSVTCDLFSSQRLPGQRSVDFDGKRWYEFGGGADHETIARTFPELRPFLRWHICFEQEPMHYAANAIYFAQSANGVALHMSPYDTHARAIEAFKSTVVFGAVERDELPACLTKSETVGTPAEEHREKIRSEVEAWCAARLPALQEAFRRDMATVQAICEKL